jgi:hypothetical protein
MNAGYRLSKWFRQEFGSTQCRAITGCDFSSISGVSKYIENNYVTRCREIAAKVAEKVQETITDLEAIRNVSPGRAAVSALES